MRETIIAINDQSNFVGSLISDHVGSFSYSGMGSDVK
jgi:hypothetical protein